MIKKLMSLLLIQANMHRFSRKSTQESNPDFESWRPAFMSLSKSNNGLITLQKPSSTTNYGLGYDLLHLKE